MNIEHAKALFGRVAVVLNREDCAGILRRLLADPLSSEAANELVARLRSALPELADMDDSRLSVYAEHGPDHECLDIRRVLLAIDGHAVELRGGGAGLALEGAGMSREIASLSSRVEGLIQQDGASEETVRAVAECLAELVRRPEYLPTVAVKTACRTVQAPGRSHLRTHDRTKPSS